MPGNIATGRAEMRRRTVLLSTLAAGLAAPALGPTLARAQAWPARPMRLIVPWPPGQATDLAGRVIAQRLSETLGQAMVPENRAGAGGQIGTDAVAKAAPDGYTLLAASLGPITTSPLVQRTAYNPERDLAAIASFGLSPYIVVTNPNFPAKTIEEFLALVRANPGKYTYATSGTGAAAHLIALMFHAAGKIEGVHVPFQGSAPGLTAVVAGQVDYAIETLAGTNPLIREGRLRPLAVTLAKGTTLAPQIPPLARLPGFEGFDVGAWVGMMAPAGTPQPVLDRLGDEVEKAMGAPEVKERFVSIAVETMVHRGPAFAAYLRDQREKFREVIQANNLRLDG
jgi:tripartite-type tricarboxylate transporter receptor subunit TctC